MATSWPTTIPPPTLSGYQYKDNERTKRIPVIGGKPRIVNMHKEAPSSYTFTLDLTSSELDIFESFYASVNYGEDEIDVEVITGNGFFTTVGRLVGEMQHSTTTYNRHIINIGFEGNFSKPTGVFNPNEALPTIDAGDDVTEIPANIIDPGELVSADLVYYDVINPKQLVFPE